MATMNQSVMNSTEQRLGSGASSSHQFMTTSPQYPHKMTTTTTSNFVGRPQVTKTQMTTHYGQNASLQGQGQGSQYTTGSQYGQAAGSQYGQYQARAVQQTQYSKGPQQMQTGGQYMQQQASQYIQQQPGQYMQQQPGYSQVQYQGMSQKEQPGYSQVQYQGMTQKEQTGWMTQKEQTSQQPGYSQVPYQGMTQKEQTGYSQVQYQGMTQKEMGEYTKTTSGQEQIISERVVEHQVRVPKKVIREDVIEKVIIVPEKVVHEEIVEEVQVVREKIIEIAKPVIQERIVEVPEIEYVEKIVEVAERVIQEKIKEVPRLEMQERIIHVPKIVVQEKTVEVPEIEYREVPYEKVVEVPQVQEQYVTKNVSVPQYVERPEAQYVNIEVSEVHERNIPVPVEAVSTFEYTLPRVRPVCRIAKYPLYVPKFVEVVVPEEMMDQVLMQQTARLAQQVTLLTSQTAPSLCEIENIAADVHGFQFQNSLSPDYQAAITNAWNQGSLRPHQDQPTQYEKSDVQGKRMMSEKSDRKIYQ